MRFKILLPLLLVLALALLFAAQPGTSEAQEKAKPVPSKCTFNDDVYSPRMIGRSYKIQQKQKPTTEDKGLTMSVRAVNRMLYRTYLAFGFKKSRAEIRAAKNLKQVKLESGFKPYIQQADFMVNKKDKPAGGLFQLQYEVHREWRVKGNSFGNRYNPLSNIIASVNAQLNSKKKAFILNGKSGWAPGPHANPCK